MEDQDAAIAYELYESEICPGCGTIDEEWRDPKTKRFLDVLPYQLVRHECAGCVIKEHELQEIDRDTNTPKEGLSIRYVRTDPLEYMADD